MNYDAKKAEILEKKEMVLKLYKRLYNLIADLAYDMGEITTNENNLKNIELSDWMFLLNYDEDMKKIIRLIASLNFVENPEEMKFIQALDEVIEVYIEEQEELGKKLQ